MHGLVYEYTGVALSDHRHDERHCPHKPLWLATKYHTKYLCAATYWRTAPSPSLPGKHPAVPRCRERVLGTAPEVQQYAKRLRECTMPQLVRLTGGL